MMKPISLVIVLGFVSVVFSFSCKDQNNNDVDWFTVYKMPKEREENSIPGISSGHGFYYMDAKDKTSLKPSQEDLSSQNQAIAYTLNQYYAVKDDASIFYAMYNDEPYESWMEMLTNRLSLKAHTHSVQFGHTKGTIFFNGNSGVWLIHSVPKFPPPASYSYPNSGTEYGQTMLCLTLGYEELATIGTQLYFNHPNFYSSNLPTNMASENPDLAKAIAGQYQQSSPGSSIKDIKTRGGQIFKSFAKSPSFGDDLYQALVAPTLRVHLIVESWRRGSEIPLDCGALYKVNDALTMKVGATSEFKYTNDHSKMARSHDSINPWLCIGDINRMTSQYVRGGGTMCLNDAFVWKAWSVISSENNC